MKWNHTLLESQSWIIGIFFSRGNIYWKFVFKITDVESNTFRDLYESKYKQPVLRKVWYKSQNLRCGWTLSFCLVVFLEKIKSNRQIQFQPKVAIFLKQHYTIIKKTFIELLQPFLCKKALNAPFFRLHTPS